MPKKNVPRGSLATPGPREVAEIMLGWLDLEVVNCTNLQTLWAGYGHICAVGARPKSSSKAETSPSSSTASSSAAAAAASCSSSAPTRLILKLISPPPVYGADEGHLRKMLSYEVEQYFYSTISPTLPPDVAVAKCLASTHDLHSRDAGTREALEGVTAMLLTDLRPSYPVAGGKRAFLTERQVYAALEWLARFHGGSRGTRTKKEMEAYILPPLDEDARRQKGGGGSKLWLNGGYTYLATRRSELADLEDDTGSEWSAAFCDIDKELGMSVADAVAHFLTPRGRACESVIHGDVKSENLFTSKSGEEVAFFDFQYVGLGLGVCDLAKLFTCSVPLDMLAADIPHKLGMERGERELLERYRRTMTERAREQGREAEYGWDEMVRHWETALVDWCRFQASWGFWGNTEWLEARVRSILADGEWRGWLKAQLRDA